MENIDSSENLNILEELDRKSSSPSLEFKNSLRTRVISSYIEPKEGRFFFNERTINYLSVFIVILSIGIVTGAGIISFNNGSKVLNIDSVAAVPAAKKPEILEGIIKNNPDALIFQTSQVVSEAPTTVASVAETAQKVSVSPEVKGYNFSFTKASTEFGQNIVCSSNSNVTKEIFNYSEDNLNIYRVVNLDANNEVADSVQVETKNDVTTSKYSRAGVGQVLFSANNLEPVATPISAPVSTPVSGPQVTTTNINNYFNGNTETINEVTKDGSKYYVIETLGNYDCNGKIVNAAFKNWFNKEDFSLYKKEIYKTNSTEVNLIERTTYNVANQQVRFEDIKGNFLSNDAENSIDITKEDSLETLESFLNNNLENIPGNSSLSNLKIAGFQDLSLSNPNFYKDQFTFLQSINSSRKPLLTYKLGDVNVEVYNNIITNSNLFNSQVEGDSKDIRVGDNFYTGEFFKSTLPISYTVPQVTQKFVVEINGLKYVFSSTNLDSIINNGLDNLVLSDIFYANKI